MHSQTVLLITDYQISYYLDFSITTAVKSEAATTALNGLSLNLHIKCRMSLIMC